MKGFGLGTIEASLNRGKIKARTCGALLGGRFEGRLAFRSFEALVEREMLHWVGVVGNGYTYTQHIQHKHKCTTKNTENRCDLK